jgi:serine/threonine-protein kinase
MATVHLGRLFGAVGFARTVAIKRLHEQFARDPEFVTMFLDEARLAARVSHPNVVSTLDVVALDGELFIVMDYVHGDSVARLARATKARGQMMDPKIASSVVASALHGLHAAHEARSEAGARLNIVHRDVSPQNILVGADGVPRMLDFGVAKATNRLQSTHDGRLKGKFRYMPPEQLRNENVDRRTDIYAAGVVLWEILTGERYIKGDEPAAMVFEILSRESRSPRAIRPDLPAALEEVVMRALTVDQNGRWATAEQMAQALEDAGGFVSSHQLGRWVRDLAQEVLEDRARQVSALESTYWEVTPDSGPLPVQPECADESTLGSHTSNLESAAAAARPRSRLPWIGAAVVALTIAGAGSVIGITHRSNARKAAKEAQSIAAVVPEETSVTPPPAPAAPPVASSDQTSREPPDKRPTSGASVAGTVHPAVRLPRQLGARAPVAPEPLAASDSKGDSVGVRPAQRPTAPVASPASSPPEDADEVFRHRR